MVSGPIESEIGQAIFDYKVPPVSKGGCFPHHSYDRPLQMVCIKPDLLKVGNP